VAGNKILLIQAGWGWKGPLKVPWSNLLLKQGHPELAAQDHEGWSLHNLPASARLPAQWRSVSWHSGGASCIPVYAHCLWSWHWALLRRAWLPS